jgi:hypothetical protein
MVGTADRPAGPDRRLAVDTLTQFTCLKAQTLACLCSNPQGPQHCNMATTGVLLYN